MKVYIAHLGEYSDRRAVAVFRTKEAALGWFRSHDDQVLPELQWVLRRHPEWNGVIPDDYFDIEEHEVEE